ncbi:dethiobiotin synthase [Thalassotalea euphylliae]|uniref:dethiobiotin synthase n=1 Tax=Thalassotalea euphylliae TaxID=1655234 RepID=UPI00362C1767
MTKHIFVTATDTDAGKTLVASALVQKLTKTNKVAVFKPISAGCENVDGELQNGDAIELRKSSNCGQTLSSVNPIAFKDPIAPHIAANASNVSITTRDIIQHFNSIAMYQPDIIVSEGAGGWRLPIGNGDYLSSFAQQSCQDVVLVVNMKLGCLNHALLTFEAIKSDGLECVGWIANCIENMDVQTENINELKRLLPAPCLGVVPRVKDAVEASEYISTPNL